MKHLATVLAAKGEIYVKLTFAHPASNTRNVHLLMITQSPLYHALYVEEEATLMIFGWALTGIDEDVVAFGTNATPVSQVGLAAEEYLGFLDLQVTQLLHFSPLSTHNI